MQVIEFGKRAIKSGPRAGHVVHADADRDEVGLHRQCLGELDVDDVADPPATHGEIGVRQPRVVLVDHHGQPVGEAP